MAETPPPESEEASECGLADRMGRAEGVMGEAMFAYELGMKAGLVVVIELAVFPFVVIADLAILTGFGSKESSKVATGSANGVKP